MDADLIGSLLRNLAKRFIEDEHEYEYLHAVGPS
jgi:hypothetical protein